MSASREQLAHLTRILIMAQKALTDGDMDEVARLLAEGTGERNGMSRVHVPFETAFKALCLKTGTKAAFLKVDKVEGGQQTVTTGGPDDLVAYLDLTLRAGAQAIADARARQATQTPAEPVTGDA